MRDSRRGIRTRSVDAGQHLGFDGGFLSGQELQKPLGSHDLGIGKQFDEVVKLLFLAHLNLCPEASPSMFARRGVALKPNGGRNVAFPASDSQSPALLCRSTPIPRQSPTNRRQDTVAVL